jgi:trehalose-phosphatase
MAPASHDDAATAVRTLRAQPGSTAVLVDFDGTLAPIVRDREAAVPLPGMVEALTALCDDYALVAVVSGRPVSYLQRHLPGDLVMVGLYGLERVRDGRLEHHPEVAGWRSVVEEVVDAARLICVFDARPGRQYASDDPHYCTPDVHMH